MQRGRLFTLATAAIVIAAASAQQAHAVPLLPGQTVILPGEASVIGIPIPGAQVTSAFNATGGQSGTLKTDVFMAGSGLTFLFQVINTGTASLQGEIAINYAGYATDVDTTTGNPDPSFFTGGTQGPNRAIRSADGSQVIFRFDTNGAGGLAPGAVSDVYFVRTNASDYQSVINTITFASGDTGQAASFGPTGPLAVPEPSAAALAFIALPLLGIGRMLRRRARAA